MKTLTLSIFSLLFFFFFTPTISNDDCAPSSCLPTEYQVRFPFQLIGRQPTHCGWPGFNLNCSSDNHTTLVLPSGDVPVKRISYNEQTITIDPQFCLPNKLIQFMLSGTAFGYSSLLTTYSIFNCSYQLSWPMDPVIFDCLSRSSYTIYAIPTDITPPGCRNISQILMPISVRRYTPDELELQWFVPDCRFCEAKGGTCETSSSNPNDVVCHGGLSSQGFTRSTKYEIFLGVGVPALLCLFMGIYFTHKRRAAQSQSRQQSVDLSSITTTTQPNLLTGLDGPTIESYPKTVLGESRRLLKPNDGPCPICLSDYQPKEELRTIPECNHYFHLECIDEWLRLNATCPLCRKPPESSNVTQCTSILSLSSTSASASTSTSTSSQATTKP